MVATVLTGVGSASWADGDAHDPRGPMGIAAGRYPPGNPLDQGASCAPLLVRRACLAQRACDQLGDAEPLGPGPDLSVVEPVTLDSQHAYDVTPLPI